ncbi:MAG TPA: hypothetical protein ENI23_11855 [bacterium]|nr:hypothetical protein [bacterium]
MNSKHTRFAVLSLFCTGLMLSTGFAIYPQTAFGDENKAPALESLAKLLEATGEDFPHDFFNGLAASVGVPELAEDEKAPKGMARDEGKTIERIMAVRRRPKDKAVDVLFVLMDNEGSWVYRTNLDGRLLTASMRKGGTKKSDMIDVDKAQPEFAEQVASWKKWETDTKKRNSQQ